MNLLIVDDNPDVVEGLKMGLDWEKLGFEEPFCAYNAPQAKRILEWEDISILLTDIEMPGENGLALFHWTRERMPDLKCIFLTSHADFHYCQEALREGGYDYIVQPARVETIQAVVGRCRQDILSEQQERILLEQGMEYEKMILCRHLFEAGESFAPKMKEWLRDMDSLGTIEGYVPTLIEFYTDTEEEFLKERELIEEIRTLFGKKMIVSRLENQLYGGIFCCACVQDEESAKDLIRQIEKRLPMKIAVYAGEIYKEDLPRAVQRIKDMRRNNVLRKTGVFFWSKENNKKNIVKDPSPEQWQSWILDKEGTLVKNQVHNLIEYAENVHVLTLEYMKMLFCVYTEALTGACHELNITFSDLFGDELDLEQFYQSYEQVETFESAVGGTLSALEERRSDTGESQMSNEERIHIVEKYVESHLSEPLSRAEMSGMVFMSEGYFSREFKKINGRGFKEYVMESRIEMAKTLLRETRYPIGVISSRVGYDNFSNFTQAFKKYTGVTPAEYRKNSQNG